MYRTEETPSFRKQLTDRGGFQFGKESTTMDTTEVSQVTEEIELFGDNGKTGELLKIKTCLTDKVTRS